jgi:TPR repeat protein
MYHEGEGVEKNNSEAVKWFLQATQRRHREAYFALGLMYEHGEGVEQNYAKAVECYQKGAKRGDEQAQCTLGNMYLYGRGVKQNYVKAVELFRMAARKEYIDALHNLGYMYYNGKGVEQDYAKAIEWYEKAAKKGDPVAQCDVGYAYQIGEGVEKNIKKAVEWHQKASEQGVGRAQVNLGLCYVNGEGVEKNIEKALELYEQAFKNGFDLGAEALGYTYEIENSDYDKAKYWYEKGVEKGNANSMFALGQLYEKGLGVDASLEKAIELYKQACVGEFISKEAAYRLGYIYYDGEGVAQDKEKALEYFQKAHDNGYECMYAIDMVKFELSEKQINKKSAQDGGDNLMRVYAEGIIKNKNFFTNLPTRVLKDLEKDFADTWQLLDKKTKDSLFTAILFYVQTYSYGPGIYGNIDFAPTINGICKALEIELGKILYTGYVKYLIDQNINPNSFPKKRGFLKQVSGYEYTYNKPEDVSNFTLGNLKHIVGLDKEILLEVQGCGIVENRRSAKNKIDKTMIDYIRFICKEESFGYLEERAISEYIIYLTQEVGSIADSLRNPASHSEIMKCARAEVCGNYVVKVKKILRHFLEKIDIDKFNELLNKKG